MYSDQLTKALRIALALTMLVTAVIAPVSALADTYTFNVLDGNWNVPGNWFPQIDAPPDADDLAIIPDGTVCRVKTRDEDALEVLVEAGGTLSVYLEDDATNGPGVLDFNATYGAGWDMLIVKGTGSTPAPLISAEGNRAGMAK